MNSRRSARSTVRQLEIIINLCIVIMYSVSEYSVICYFHLIRVVVRYRVIQNESDKKGKQSPLIFNHLVLQTAR